MKTCLFSFNNPVDIHPRAVGPPLSVDNPPLINTLINTFFHTLPFASFRPAIRRLLQREMRHTERQYAVFAVMFFCGYGVIRLLGYTVIGYTVMGLYGYWVLRLYGYGVIRLLGFAVIRLWGYTIIGFCGYTVIRLLGYWVLRLCFLRLYGYGVIGLYTSSA